VNSHTRRGARLRMSRWLGMVGLCVALLALIAGCGSSSTSTAANASANSSTDLTSYQALANQAEHSLTSTTFNGPTVAFHAPRDIKLAVIACSTSVSGCLSGANGVKKAAELLNWKVTVFNGNADPSTQNDLIEQAVNSGFQAIILVSIQPNTVASGLAAANARKIPVGSDTAAVPPSPGGVAYDVDADWSTAGKGIGALIVAQSGGHANLLDFKDKEFQSQVDLSTAVTAEVASCSTCKVQPVQPVVVADVGPSLGVRVVNLLQKDSAINFVDMGFDPAADVVVPAIKQAGFSNVKLVAANAEPQNLEWIKQGEVQSGDLTYSFVYAAYATVDQMARLLAHKPLIKTPGVSNLAYAYGEGTPWGIITQSGLNGVPIPKANGNIAFAIEAKLPQLYGHLWGVS
jgi:ribose transport system substrate-binding protein